MRSEFIAEAGVNHNGDMGLAKELIEVASESGADYVKFQSFRASSLVTVDASLATYQNKNIDGQHNTQREMLTSLELSVDEHLELREKAKQSNIKFLSTAFSTDELDFLINDLDIDTIKVPSGEVDNVPYLRSVGTFGRRVFLSTGMSTVDEIKAAIELILENGLDKNLLTIMHCVSSYPTPNDQANLGAISHLRTLFDMSVGYSDHTLSLTAPIVAVSLGATVIEKHFTLSRDMQGPDHAASIEPLELKQVIDTIREVELLLGPGQKVPQSCELENLTIVRKKIVASCDISAGEALSEKNITTKRAPSGIPASRWDLIIGTPASRHFSYDDPIG
jgi:N,N'-diacetyllegionaminate synthase